MSQSDSAVLLEAQRRKVCERGHTLGWRPWYRSASSSVAGHCVCGAPYRWETRGPKPLSRRGIVDAGDWLAIEFPDLEGITNTEDVARVAVRAYLSRVEEDSRS